MGVQHRGDRPWSCPREAEQLYEDMGAVESGCEYVAVWIHLGDVSLAFLSKGQKTGAVAACMNADEPLNNRLKLLINPVIVKLPFPAKNAEDADTIGKFFGRR